MEKVIEVSNVRKKYALYNRKIDKVREAFSVRRRKYHDDFEALKGISFSVNKGECVGIIGLNGSGKSTLLKILADVIKPTQGQINVRGTVSALLELGAGFNPEYTGMENIYLTTMLMGFSRSETDSKLQDILEFADIGRFIDQPVKNYSSGMFVRLAFSIAIAVEPDILLIDEALSVGDVFFQQKCYNKIREFAQKSTVIIVSHDLNAITKFCQRVILLNQGILIYDGEPRSGVTEYYKIKQGEINNRITQSSTFVIDRSKYRVPTAENYSGHMDVMITGYYYQIGNAPFETYCEAGKKIVFQMLVKSNRKIENVIIGYQVRDKYGNEVFGETSLTSGYPDIIIEEGESNITLVITWPEIREGDYFITLGIGEGYEVLNQVEQCWINNAIYIKNTTYDKLIYGVFNNEMEEVRIERI